MSDTTEKFNLKIQTVFGKETNFQGNLFFRESLRIDGKFNGKIESTGFLVINNGAEVVADITAGVLVVSGSIKGNIIARERLEIQDGGEIIGNIQCPNLIMAEQTSFQGQCEMLDNAASIDVFSMPLEQLRKNLTVVK